MKVEDIFEDAGRNDYHPESYFAPIVAKFVKDEGVAQWDDIFAYVEMMVDLTGADKASAPGSNIARWKKSVSNLHAHRRLEGGKFGDIVRIKGGFATKQAAKDQGIEVLPDNSMSPRNPGKRDAKDIKRKVGTIVNTAYNEAGRPKLRDVTATRSEIENMVKQDPWLEDSELIDMAKEIIARG